MNCGPIESLVVLLVLLLVIAPFVLPRVRRNAGKYADSFRRGLRDGEPPPEVRGELTRDDDPDRKGPRPGG